MSDRRQDDMASQAWPGYVDILSATVIMFVFFVMVIVVVLYLYTIKFTATVQQQAEQKIQETIQKTIETPETLGELEEEKSKTIQEISELEKQKQTIKKEVQALEKQVKQLSTGLEEGDDQSIIINDKEMIILFSNNAITLTNDTIGRFVKFLELYPDISRINITSGDNPLAVSQSNERKSILARMLNARNIALDSGFDKGQITINYVEAEKIDNSYNWVRIKVD